MPHFCKRMSDFGLNMLPADFNILKNSIDMKVISLNLIPIYVHILLFHIPTTLFTKGRKFNMVQGMLTFP